MAKPRELMLPGGTRCLRLGDGPPLVVLRTAVPSSANPRGLERWSELRLLRPLARRFTVYAVGRRPGLQRGVTMADLAAHHAEELGEHGRALQRRYADLVAAGRHRRAGAELAKGLFASPVARRLLVYEGRTHRGVLADRRCPRDGLAFLTEPG